MKAKTTRLTKKTALELMGQVAGVRRIDEKVAFYDGVIFTASIGELEVKCENGWPFGKDRFRLTIADRDSSSNRITMYFYPETLERDFETEDAMKKELQQEDRREWVQAVGREWAHRVVDQYCDE